MFTASSMPLGKNLDDTDDLSPSNGGGGRLLQSAFLNRQKFLFGELNPAGRQIVLGFSYLQRIGHSASTHLWFPPTLEEKIALRIKQKDISVLDEFRVEWAAVRQFELLQESGNQQILPLDAMNIQLSTFFLSKMMRAGGQRVTIITMGRYTEESSRDDLQTLDQKLQETISNFISMLYLEKQSMAVTNELSSLRDAEQWRYSEALPHVAIALGTNQIFTHKHTSKMEAKFFQLLDMLPQQHIRHDVVVGLQIPEAKTKNDWIYLPEADERLHIFQSTLTDIFRKFDGLSLGKLQGREDAPQEIKATTGHMRGYGDHMRPDHGSYFCALASLTHAAKPNEM